ncbi:uncharacterized protein FIBRA_06652 [Fibroporia radiculosa]|uniref:Uncharacterized protein n=1 Tax=Fibroporia radiculosa TaxID=599839 RepID=J4HZG1_9APHY|nr:uncharacterized protein FIBRA_06652 [Fibroporia radiculosa]CCM04472.1 predicted protein [Fibroporia radiculosa]
MASAARNSQPLTTAEGFACGGLAACVAVTITNPAEVAKTRLQLQGELAKDGGVKVYRNTFDVLGKSWRHEGIRGVQRGLGPAAYSSSLPVGTQRYYKNAFHALRSVYREEGLRGMIRGVDAAVLRTAMGSTVQLPVYNWTKNHLIEHDLLPANSIWTFLASSSVSGMCVLAAMQPADTALTRMYNQPTRRLPDGKVVGTLYRHPIDCLWKTLRTEGFFGWYKGSFAHFIRIMPHTVVTLTANDIIIGLYKRYRDRSS